MGDPPKHTQGLLPQLPRASRWAWTRTRKWARGPEQVQHPFAQVPHGAWHHHQLGRHGDLHHSFYKLCVAWEGHWALLIKAPLNSKMRTARR